MNRDFGSHCRFTGWEGLGNPILQEKWPGGKPGHSSFPLAARHGGGMVTSAKIDGEECSGPMIPSYILLLAEDYAR